MFGVSEQIVKTEWVNNLGLAFLLSAVMVLCSGWVASMFQVATPLSAVMPMGLVLAGSIAGILTLSYRRLMNTGGTKPRKLVQWIVFSLGLSIGLMIEMQIALSQSLSYETLMLFSIIVGMAYIAMIFYDYWDAKALELEHAIAIGPM